MVDIATATGIPELTLRTMRKQADKIKERCKSEIWMMANTKTDIMVPIMEKLERMLAQWMEQKYQVPLLYP
jgi:hypothetical protein